MTDLPPAINCRAAREADLDALVALENASFAADRMPRRQWRYHLKNEQAKIWVCADKSGTLAACLLGLFHTNRPARIYSVATAAAWRGKGLGRHLVKKFIREARRRGRTKAVLEVRQDSAAAIRLYEQIGFTVAAPLPSYYEDGGDGFKMMMKLR